MDERLNELLETVQRTADTVSRKGGELLSAARMRMQLAELEREADECLKEAGQMVYATHTGTPTPSEALLAKLREVDVLRARITELRRESGCWRCAACGGNNQSGDAFCRACGKRL